MAFEKAKLFEKGRLKVHTDEYEGVPLIIAIGECDAYTVDALKKAFNYAVEAGVKELIVDIRTMDYVDASGYHALVKGRQVLEEIDATMVIVDLTHTIECVVKLLEFDALMTIVATLGQAVKHIKRYPLQPPKPA